MILNLDRALYVSIGFFLIFLAYMSCSIITSKILDDFGYNTLGFYSLGLVYFAFAIMSPISSAIIEKKGAIFALRVGSISYFLYISALLFPTIKEQHPDSDLFIFSDGFIYTIILLFAFINGLGSSLLWCG